MTDTTHQGASPAPALVWTPERLDALERDQLLFRNNPDLCQDCGLLEACDCRGQWSTVAVDTSTGGAQ